MGTGCQVWGRRVTNWTKWEQGARCLAVGIAVGLAAHIAAGGLAVSLAVASW